MFFSGFLLLVHWKYLSDFCPCICIFVAKHQVSLLGITFAIFAPPSYWLHLGQISRFVCFIVQTLGPFTSLVLICLEPSQFPQCSEIFLLPSVPVIHSLSCSIWAVKLSVAIDGYFCIGGSWLLSIFPWGLSNTTAPWPRLSFLLMPVFCQ